MMKFKQFIKGIITNRLTYVFIISIILQTYMYKLVEKYTILPDTPSYINYNYNILMGEVDYIRTPIYPYFCKLIKLIGGNYNMYSNIVLAQKILFLFSIALFYLTVKKIFKSKFLNTALVSIYALCPFIFMWNTLILTEAISIVEIVALLYLTVSYLKKAESKLAILIGIQLLLLVMTRPSNVYLLAIYFLFWILKLIIKNPKENKKIHKMGLLSTCIAIILTILYCNQVRIYYGVFGLTSVSEVNNTIIVIDSGLYKNGDNLNIINDIDATYNPNDNNTTWTAREAIIQKYGVEAITKFDKYVVNSSRKDYILYMIKKIFTIGNLNIGIIYSETINNHSNYNINTIFNVLFPMSFSLTYICLIIAFIEILYLLIKHKKLEWLLCALFTIIAGNLFLSIFFAPYETQRLCLISIPLLIVLIPYLILKITENNKNEKTIESKKNNSKINSNKKSSGINEFFEYIFSFNIKSLFKEKTNNTFIQFFRYLFVGGIAAVVNIGMLYVFTDIIHIHYIISNILSFIMGLSINYILSKKFVFQEETKISSSKEFLIYAIIGVIGLGIDTLLVWLFTDILSIYYMISKLISTMIVFIWNFGARKILYKIIK